MNTQRLIAILATTLALGATANSAMAETQADMSFDGMSAMKMIDKDKDGMVSKKEFLDMMSKMWDEKGKKMTIKFDKMSAEQWREIQMYLRAGG